jgi:lysyl endopeptidase
MLGKEKYYRQLKILYWLTTVLLPLLLPAAPVYSQVSYGGMPVFPDNQTELRIPVITMPSFDIQKYRQEVAAESDPRLKPLVFARPFNLNIDPLTDGFWETTALGERIWRIAFHSAGAFSLNLIFTRFRLNPGVSLFIYNIDRSHILGAYNHKNNLPSGSLATEPVKGEMIIVEMHVEKELYDFGEIEIGKLNHDFIGILETKSVSFGRSEPCNIDITCQAGNPWQTEQKSVAMVLITGNTFCSGVLVNNTSKDGTPYLLTANHCVSDSATAANTIFIFKYESPFCHGNEISEYKTVAGAELLITQKSLDFSLLKISSIPPVNARPWYAGWDRSGDTPQYTSSIHHPNGDVKKISLDTDSPVTGTFSASYALNGHWKIERWDLGTTEKGSSGSPLFDPQGRVIGLLTGGAAVCGNAINDYYCKLSKAWEIDGLSQQLGSWLDPLNSNIQTLDGFYPYRDNELRADFTISTTGVCVNEKIVFSDYSSGEIDMWHWDFGDGADPPYALTQGPHHVRYSGSGDRNISLTVGNDTGFDQKDTLFTIDIKSDELPSAGFEYTQADLNVQFIDLSENAGTYYWEFGDRKTSLSSDPVNTYPASGEYVVKQLVRNSYCADTVIQVITITVTSSPQETTPELIKIYPVPADNYIYIDATTGFRKNSFIELYSITGQSLINMNLIEGENMAVIDVGKYPPGNYIITISAGDQQVKRVITISR